MRSAFPCHLGGLQDLAVGVPEGLSVELLLGLLLLALGRLSEAEQVVVEEWTDGGGRDLVEVHLRVVKNSGHGVGGDVDAVLVQVVKVQVLAVNGHVDWGVVARHG